MENEGGKRTRKKLNDFLEDNVDKEEGGVGTVKVENGKEIHHRKKICELLFLMDRILNTIEVD